MEDSIASRKRPVPEQQLRSWAGCLMNPHATLVSRSRALWGLRHARELLAVELIGTFLQDIVEPSPIANVLLQHEAAYILGQRGNPEAIPYLEQVVQDSRHHPVVRHEAAEALAALCEVPSVKVSHIESLLQEFSTSNVVELAETCHVGLNKIRWLRDQVHDSSSVSTAAKSLFPETIDPAPGFAHCDDARRFHTMLMDPTQPLFDRFKALFSLRDAILNAQLETSRSIYSVSQLGCWLSDGLSAPGSALLRHEVAFVLGQLALRASVPGLVACLNQLTEHPMVRHEAAEALGNILGHLESEADSVKVDHHAKAARAVLERFLNDEEPLVRESCVLALDIADYIAAPDQLQYVVAPT